MRMCLADANCVLQYMDVVRTVASRWENLSLEQPLDEWAAQIDEAFQLDGRREASIEMAWTERDIRRTFIRGRAQALLAALEPASP
jgi:hypothetical protein